MISRQRSPDHTRVEASWIFESEEMKHGYFTSKTIVESSRRMLRELEEKGLRRKAKFVLEHAALLVLDMQRYFLDESSHAYIPSAPPVVEGIRKLAEAFRKRNRPVILTRHVNSAGDAGMLARWWSDLIDEGNPSSEIIAELDMPGLTVVKKTQYDAFFGTHLGEALSGNRVSQVVVSGVLTHLCCETTARSAFVRGYEVFLPIDGTATYSEDFHRAAFLSLSHGFAVPVLVEDLIAGI